MISTKTLALYYIICYMFILTISIEPNWEQIF